MPHKTHSKETGKIFLSKDRISLNVANIIIKYFFT